MYCKNCGKQIEEESRFCQYCGAINESVSNQEMQKTIPVKKEKKKRKKKKTVIIIVIAIFIVLGAILLLSGDDSLQAEQFIDLVQNGYLGNYDTVTIKEVLDYVNEDAEWNAGEAVSGDHYVVECKGSDMTIQFSVDGLEEKLFKVTGIQIPGIDSSDMEAYDVKIYLDNLYLMYADTHPEKGLYIDVSISNDTLEGHVGPVRAAEKSFNSQLETDGQTQEENWDFITEPLTYGLYSYDDGMGTTGTAEVGFSTDEDGGDYINIECWRNDREIASFSGTLEDNGEGYYAYCEDLDSSILVTFADGGLYVQLMYSNYVDMDSLEGFYSLTKALNLNEVS